MVTGGFGWALRMPVRTVDIVAEFRDENGDELRSFDSIHHRNERLVGLADVLIEGLYVHRWKGEGVQNWLNLKLGIDVPTGNIEPDPYVLGANGESHQHVFFGSGTFDPSLDVSWGGQTTTYIWSVSARADKALYENKYGYEKGLNVETALAGGYRPNAQWLFMGSAELFHDAPSKWSGRPARNSGSTGVSIGTQISYAFDTDRRLSFGVERPFVLVNREGTLEIPIVIRLGFVQQWQGEVKAPAKP